MVATTTSIRRLKRGAVSVALDYDASHVVLMCTRHGIDQHVPFVTDRLGSMLIRFFELHQQCSRGAEFEIEDETLARR